VKSITLAIDGKTISVPDGTSILAAADRLGIKIPRLCFHPDLKPFGSCRMCLVEDEKTGRLTASCVTPAAPDMIIRTGTPRILRHRRNIVRLMIAEHPESCIVCNKGNRCQLRQVAANLGIGEVNLYSMPNPKALEEANPFIVRDLTKCILCGKCIRADHELVVVGAIDYNHRGFKSRPATVHEKGLEQSSCTFCGTCVSMCPTGALSPKSRQFVGTPEREALSICGFCGVGCSLYMGVSGDRIVEVNPSHRQDTVNGATLCIRGHFANDFLNSPDRLHRPLIGIGPRTGSRTGGERVPASWDDALDQVASRLMEIRRTEGPQSVGFLGSSKCTNEENYLFQKLARAVLKTNNIDTAGFFSGQRLRAHLHARLKGRFPVQPLSRLESADAILVIGADPEHSVPVVGYYLKRAVKKGAALVVADPRKTGLVHFASAWLPLAPGSDLDLIHGLAALVSRKRRGKEEQPMAAFLERYTTGADAFRSGLEDCDLNRVSRTTGIDPAMLDAAADLLLSRRIGVVAGGGLLKQRQAAPALDALVNLALITGCLEDSGAGLHLTAAENNQVGAWDMGAAPDALPGRQQILNEDHRKGWERAWQVKISPDAGLNCVRMIEEAEKGNLKALYILGENPLRSFPQPDRVRAAFDRLEFLVVQDILLTETAQSADVILPGAAFSEKGGSFTNLEGRIQAFDPVVRPPGEAKPDWEILARLAERAGGRRYASFEEIREEIRQNVPMYGLLPSSSRSAWVEEIPQTEKIALIPPAAAAEPAALAMDADYPYTAILAASRYHLGSGTRTSRSDRIGSFPLNDAVELSIADAQRLGIEAGQIVRIVSPWGELARGVCLQRALRPGCLLIPTAFRGNEAQKLIGLSAADRADFTGWNTVRVRIEKKE